MVEEGAVAFDGAVEGGGEGVVDNAYDGPFRNCEA